MTHVLFSRYEPPFTKMKLPVCPAGMVGCSCHIAPAWQLTGAPPLCSLLGPLEGAGVLTVVLSPEPSLSGADSGLRHVVDVGPWRYLCGLSLVLVSKGYSLVAVHRPLISVASLVAEQGSWARAQ